MAEGTQGTQALVIHASKYRQGDGLSPYECFGPIYRCLKERDYKYVLYFVDMGAFSDLTSTSDEGKITIGLNELKTQLNKNIEYHQLPAETEKGISTAQATPPIRFIWVLLDISNNIEQLEKTISGAFKWFANHVNDAVAGKNSAHGSSERNATFDIYFGAGRAMQTMLLTRLAVQAQAEGFNTQLLDYVGSPKKETQDENDYKTINADPRGLERQPKRNESASQTLIGDSDVFKDCIHRAQKVAALDVNVFLYGDSGSGKEEFAKIIHENSDRNSEKFVVVNCAALTPELFESEMFGHEKGAFTGAYVQHTGFFEQANKGTLFLDEIAELPSDQQAKLLRVIQDGSVRRVGGKETKSIDVRVIFATHRNLRVMAEEKAGGFRLDLLYRICNGAVLRIPSLRERQKDVILLAKHFLQSKKADSRSGLKLPKGISRFTLSSEARQWLTEQYWPGNIRQLQGVLMRASLNAYLHHDIGTSVSECEIGKSDLQNADLKILLPNDDESDLQNTDLKKPHLDDKAKPSPDESLTEYFSWLKKEWKSSSMAGIHPAWHRVVKDVQYGQMAQNVAADAKEMNVSDTSRNKFKAIVPMIEECLSLIQTHMTDVGAESHNGNEAGTNVSNWLDTLGKHLKNQYTGSSPEEAIKGAKNSLEPILKNLKNRLGPPPYG